MRFIPFYLLVCLSSLLRLNAAAGIPTLPPQLTPPDITCPNDTVLTITPFVCEAILTYNVAVSDDQPAWSLQQTAGLVSGQGFPIGATVNQFVVTDQEGLTASCSFTVTVKDYVPPVSVCRDYVVITPGQGDDPLDCYDGSVRWVQTTAFDEGSYDHCGNNIRLSIRRLPPYSSCILGLNPTNGHPPCNDAFPDFPSEFERAITELDSIKFYCCEAGTDQTVALRAYQLNPDGTFAIGPDGIPIFNECLVTVHVKETFCAPTTNASIVAGTLQLDADNNCLTDPVPAGVSAQLIKATTATGQAYLTSSNRDGVFVFPDLPEGPATLEVLPTLPVWSVCNNATAITIPAAPSQTIQDFNLQSTVSCPLLQLDMAAGLLRRCQNSKWIVTYCNNGGAVADNAYVTLTTDPTYQIQSATKPYTIAGNTMTVQLGSVQPGECDAFTFWVDIPCQANLVGQTVCMDAHIYPDSLCIPEGSTWSGAQIEVSAECNGDSVHFALRNTGSAPTTQPLDYVIIDDMVIMYQGQIPAGLAAQATLDQTVPADGSSLRLRARQESGHPSGGSPSVLIENCNGSTSVSHVFDFTNEDGRYFTHQECREISGSYDPNELLAFPRGYEAAHYIEPGTEITYQINFQNTGNDTAFKVVLLDTLPQWLDHNSIRLGQSSHPYTWALNEDGLLNVTFDPIFLPDSIVDEPGSHGFVQFRIQPKTTTPLGTVLDNRAGIYFDINPVVMTNAVWHTVDLNFLLTGTDEPESAEWVQAFPNPAFESTFIALTNEQPMQIRLLDPTGRPVRTLTGRAPGITIPRNGLAPGLYWIEVDGGQGRRLAGKMVWR